MKVFTLPIKHRDSGSGNFLISIQDYINYIQSEDKLKIKYLHLSSSLILNYVSIIFFNFNSILFYFLIKPSLLAVIN